MSQLEQNQIVQDNRSDSSWVSFYKIGALAALLQFITILTFFFVGPKPGSAEEYFALMQDNRLLGFLRDDFFSLAMIALYLGSFFGLYAALRRIHQAGVFFSIMLVFIGVTCAFSAHSGFSMLHLSDQYAVATSESQKAQLLAAGEAVLSTDLWHSSAGYMAGILLQGGGVLVSLIMLRSQDFSKLTAYAGLLGNGVDLVQHLLYPFAPSLSTSLMMVMGPFYIVWFPLLARDLFRLGQALAKD